MNRSFPRTSKQKKILFKGLDIAFSYLIPVGLIALKYNLFTEQKAGIKLTIVGLIVVFSLLIAFWRNVSDTIKRIKNTIYRKVFSVGKNLIVAIALVIILSLSKDAIDNLIFIVISCCMSISVGNCFREDYVDIIKLEQKNERQDEMVEAILKAREIQ